MLDDEIQYYEENLPDWLQRHEAHVVLVKGRRLAGFFDNEVDALEEGVRLFGLTSFLIRRVLAVRPLIYVPVIAHDLPMTDPTLGREILQDLTRQSERLAEPAIPTC